MFSKNNFYTFVHRLVNVIKINQVKCFLNDWCDVFYWLSRQIIRYFHWLVWFSTKSAGLSQMHWIEKFRSILNKFLAYCLPTTICCRFAFTSFLNDFWNIHNIRWPFDVALTCRHSDKRLNFNLWTHRIKLIFDTENVTGRFGRAGPFIVK